MNVLKEVLAQRMKWRKLIEAAKVNCYGLRDSTMLLVISRHGLRAQEVCDLEWSAVDIK
jgi:integrase